MEQHITWTPRVLGLLLGVAPLVLAAWVGELYWQLFTGTSVVLPVQGRDPRDLLHGHYLTMEVSLPPHVVAMCPPRRASEKTVCLDAPASPEGACAQPFKVRCVWGTPVLLSPRFYIPEQAPLELLQQAIDRGRASVEFSVSRDGTPMAKRLLVDGLDWHLWVERHKPGFVSSPQ